MRNILRRARFSPYLDGKGPRFDLVIWDTHRTTSMGKSKLGYRLRMIVPGTISILFEGEDFGASPMHAIDSDNVIAAIMSFLTLRHGDTDAEYFADYTPAQLAYCAEHAEALSCYISNRYPDM